MKTHIGEIPIIDRLIIPEQIESLKKQVLGICESQKEITEAMRSVFRRYRHPHQLSRYMNLWGVVEAKVRRQILAEQRERDVRQAETTNLAPVERAPIPYRGQIDLFVIP